MVSDFQLSARGLPRALDYMSPSRYPLVERWQELNILLARILFFWLLHPNLGPIPNVVVIQALGKLVRRTSASANASQLNTVNVTGANHSDAPRIKPGSGKFLALATFLREGGPGQLDVVSLFRHPLKSVCFAQTRSVRPLKMLCRTSCFCFLIRSAGEPNTNACRSSFV